MRFFPVLAKLLLAREGREPASLFTLFVILAALAGAIFLIARLGKRHNTGGRGAGHHRQRSSLDDGCP